MRSTVLRLLAFLLFAALSGNARAAVSFDQFQTVKEVAGPVNTSYTSAANISVAANTNKFLVVSIFISATTNVLTGIVWDAAGANQGFTSLGVINGSGGRLEFWGLVNPTTGTNKSITIAFTNATNVGIVFRATSWFGVDQTIADITATFTTNSAAGNAPTITQTSTANDAVLGAFTSTASGLTSVDNTTVYTDTAGGTDASNYAAPASAGSTVLNGVTTGGGSAFTYAAITIKAAAGGGATLPAGSLMMMGVGK